MFIRIRNYMVISHYFNLKSVNNVYNSMSYQYDDTYETCTRFKSGVKMKIIIIFVQRYDVCVHAWRSPRYPLGISERPREDFDEFLGHVIVRGGRPGGQVGIGVQRDVTGRQCKRNGDACRRGTVDFPKVLIKVKPTLRQRWARVGGGAVYPAGGRSGGVEAIRKGPRVAAAAAAAAGLRFSPGKLSTVSNITRAAWG